MTTNIYASYSDFLNRENADNNGVSAEFAAENPTFSDENETNKACWNCSDCSGCSRCSGLTSAMRKRGGCAIISFARNNLDLGTDFLGWWWCAAIFGLTALCATDSLSEKHRNHIKMKPFAPRPRRSRRIAALCRALLVTLAGQSDAGSLDRAGSGLQPSQGGLAAPTQASYHLAGTVIQKLPDGLLIDTPQIRSSSKPRGIVFVQGSFPKLFNGDRVSMTVVDAGEMTYTSAGGSIEVVRKFVPAK